MDVDNAEEQRSREYNEDSACGSEKNAKLTLPKKTRSNGRHVSPDVKHKYVIMGTALNDAHSMGVGMAEVPDTINSYVTTNTVSLDKINSCGVTMTIDSPDTGIKYVTLTTDFPKTKNKNVTVATKLPDVNNRSIANMSVMSDFSLSQKHRNGTFFHLGALTSALVRCHFRSSCWRGTFWMLLLTSIFFHQIAPSHSDCAQMDTCEQGHYTCDGNGLSVCRKGWGGPDCKTRVPEEAKCSDYKGLPESIWTTSFICDAKPYTLTMNLTSITTLKFTGTILAKTESLSGTYNLDGDQTKFDAIVIKDNGWITENVKGVLSFQFALALSSDGTLLSGTATSAGCSVPGIALTQTKVTPADCSKWSSNCWRHGETYDKFSCCCLSGFRGQRCEIPPDRCAPNPCKNSGKCTTLPDYTDFKCECIVGFYDKTCSKTSKDIPCDPDPCKNGGTCFWNSTTGSRCRCKDFFEGNFCETKSNKTVPPCPSFYYGPDCKIYCKDTNSCDGHYQCNAKGEKVCSPKWIGLSCTQHETFNDTIKLEHCPDGKLCQNNGVCFNKACCCNKSFKGTYCETPVNECDSNPCKNGGTCADKNAAYECKCVRGFQGDNCEKVVDFCAPKPCKNDGVCELLWPPGTGTGYRCRCPGRWFGNKCENSGTTMSCNPCENKATCTYSPTNGFKCNCLPGSAGEKCESTAPAPPSTFKKVSRTDESLTLAWKSPSIDYGHVQTYEVACTPSHSYNPVILNEKAKYSKTQSLTWRNTTYTMKDLEPGTTYNCSIRASTLAGYGNFTNKSIATRPGKPNLSVTPKLDHSEMTATTVHISIPSFSITTGPISSFRVVVQMVSTGRLKKRSITKKTNFYDVLHRLQVYTCTNDVLHRERRATVKELTPEQIDTLTDYNAAKSKDLTHYIAAEYTQPQSSFTVGDNQRYGKYLNAPLKEGVKYSIYFGVISTLDGDSEVVYVGLGDPVTVEAMAGSLNWRVGLGVGIALIVFAFIFIIIIIFVCKPPVTASFDLSFLQKERRDKYTDGTESEKDSETTDTPEYISRRKAKLKDTPQENGRPYPVQNVNQVENDQSLDRNGSQSKGMRSIQNPAFDHEHQTVHSPVGYASDAYTLQQRLSSEERMTGSYEIDYNDSMSQFGKFDNKGFVGDGRC